MKRTLVSAIAVAASLAAGPSMAADAPQCAQRDTVVSSLERRFQERPVAVGLDNGGAIVEVLTAAAGETWTILVSMPNGMSCVVAAGENWQPRDAKPVKTTGGGPF